MRNRIFRVIQPIYFNSSPLLSFIFHSFISFHFLKTNRKMLQCFLIKLFLIFTVFIQNVFAACKFSSFSGLRCAVIPRNDISRTRTLDHNIRDGNLGNKNHEKSRLKNLIFGVKIDIRKSIDNTVLTNV